MPMVELRGLSALEAWSRKATTGYKDVKVHDLSTSWRDGLAFCALIHHFRPDLIDFDSLSKENILYNNRLAFQTAEKHLGVPALLDAEDMFKHQEPDRLSIATYLSQFYECFEGSKSDRKHSITTTSPTSPTNTNSRQWVLNNYSGADYKTNTNCITTTTPANDTGAAKDMGAVTTGAVDCADGAAIPANRPIPPRRDMKCHKCRTRVHHSDRLLHDEHCYHKSCYELMRLGDTGAAVDGDHQIGHTYQAINADTNASDKEINVNDIHIDINSESKPIDKIARVDTNATKVGQPVGDHMMDTTSTAITSSSVTSIQRNSDNNECISDRQLKDNSFGDSDSHRDVDEVVNDYESGGRIVSTDTMEAVFAEVFGKSVSISDDIDSCGATTGDDDNHMTSPVDSNTSSDRKASIDRKSSPVDRKASIDSKRSIDSKTSIDRKSSPVDRKASIDSKRSIDSKTSIDRKSSPVDRKASIDSKRSIDSKTSIDRKSSPVDRKISIDSKRSIDSKTSSEHKSSPVNRKTSALSMSATNDEDIYPDDMNPFGDEEEDGEEVVTKTKNFYPDDKNPFGDDDDDEEDGEEVVSHKQRGIAIKVRTPSDALNPFGDSEDEEDRDDSNTTPKPRPRTSLVVTPTAQLSAASSPTSSLRSRKKRQAPTPPTAGAVGIPQVNSTSSLNNSYIIGGDDSVISSRRDSVVSDVSSELTTASLTSSVPNSRTPTPLPRLRVPKSGDELSDYDITATSSPRGSGAMTTSESTGSLRGLKKRPAPPIPAVKRLVKSSLADIETELNGLGDRLPVIEAKGRELERVLMARQRVSTGSVDETGAPVAPKDDPLMNEFLTTARERCRLARRQKELMYMKREHRLEELQADIEYQMRCVISKQSAQKTGEDLKQEDELLQRLVEIIEERNDIVENMIRDENKEVEEYQKLISKVLPQKPELKPKPKQTVGAGSEGQEARQTVSKKALKEEIKLKEKLRLKDIKERKRLKKLEKQIQQKADKTDGKCGDGLDEKVDKQSKHLSLKSTLKPLKKLGLKSLSTDKSDKKSDKVVKTSSNPSPPTPTPPPNASDSVATGQTLAEDPVLANGANK